MRRVPVVAVLIALLAAAHAVAQEQPPVPAQPPAQTPPAQPPAAQDPSAEEQAEEDPRLLCEDPRYRCPDLRMARPFNLSIRRTADGRTLLMAANAILSVGRGPMAIVARRKSKIRMTVSQRIYTSSGGHVSIPTEGFVVWKAIPGQGHYWKFENAARFELWTLGEKRKLVRTGPKLVYCLRDLQRWNPSERSPRGRVFPACSQDQSRRIIRLGTSVGWADVYPSGYHENWIDVTGLRGCFALRHRADPLDHLIESDETNNTAKTVVRLPFRGHAGRC